MCHTKTIRKWQEAGLITAEQSQKIQEYEARRQKPYLKYGLFGLASFLIGLGIISLIASNWEYISDSFKIAVGFALMSASAFGCLKTYRQQKYKLFEVWLLAFALLLTGQIGIFTQIFQLQPSLTLGLTLWSLPLFPLLFFSRSGFLTFFWFPLTYYPLFILLLSNGDTTYNIVRFFNQSAWAGGISYLGALILLWFYQLTEHAFPNKLIGMKKAFRLWIIIILACQIFLTDCAKFNLFDDRFLTKDPFFYILLALSFGTALFSAFWSRKDHTSYLPTGILMIISVGHIFPLMLFGSLMASIGLCVYAYRAHRTGLMNFALFLIGFRLFIFYIEAFALIGSGFSLLFLGCMILLAVWGKRKLSAFISDKEIQK